MFLILDLTMHKADQRSLAWLLNIDELFEYGKDAREVVDSLRKKAIHDSSGCSVAGLYERAVAGAEVRWLPKDSPSCIATPEAAKNRCKRWQCERSLKDSR